MWLRLSLCTNLFVWIEIGLQSHLTPQIWPILLFALSNFREWIYLLKLSLSDARLPIRSTLNPCVFYSNAKLCLSLVWMRCYRLWQNIDNWQAAEENMISSPQPLSLSSLFKDACCLNEFQITAESWCNPQSIKWNLNIHYTYVQECEIQKMIQSQMRKWKHHSS